MPLIMENPSSFLPMQQPSITPPNATEPTLQPHHLSIPLPLSPHTTLHLQITTLATSVMVFITTTDPSSSSSLSSLGSFVYAMPNVWIP